MLTTLGLAQCHLSQQAWLYCDAQVRFRACSSKCCSWWRDRDRSPALMTSAFPPSSGVDGGHCSSTHATTRQMIMGTAPSCSKLWVCLIFTSTNRVSSMVLLRRGAGPAHQYTTCLFKCTLSYDFNWTANDHNSINFPIKGHNNLLMAIKEKECFMLMGSTLKKVKTDIKVYMYIYEYMVLIKIPVA